MIAGSEEIGKAFKLRWDVTWRALGALPQPATTFDELVAAYSESGHFYHTLKHLEKCFSHFDLAKRLARIPAEIEIAIWFHDAIYDTRRNDNEENSAIWAENVIRDCGLLPERIGDLILATKHKVNPIARMLLYLSMWTCQSWEHRPTDSTSTKGKFVRSTLGCRRMNFGRDAQNWCEISQRENTSI